MRLIVTYLGIVVMTLLFISTYILAAINQYLYNQKKVELLAGANVIANVVSEYMESDRERIPMSVSRLNSDDSTRVIDERRNHLCLKGRGHGQHFQKQ